MNRSRYVPHTAYSINPYHPQQYGPVGSSPIPGMMPAQSLTMPPSTYNPQPSMGMGHSPIQNPLSPNGMWTSNFAGPIIEDLCAPPPPPHLAGMPSTSPPMNALPPRMAMSQMHPSAMPQIQNVYGIRQPMPGQHHQFAQAMHQQQQAHHQAQMQQQQQQRVMMGSYPPFGIPQSMQQHQAQQQQGMGFAQTQQQQQQRTFDPTVGMGRPRLETGFPSAVPGGVVGVNGGVMQGQVGSPHVGGSPGGDGGMGGSGAPLTPVEEALRGFLSPDLGDLGH